MGRTFKTFDKWEDGVVISTKSVDLNAKTYQSGSGLYNKLHKDLKAIRDFTHYELGKTAVKESDIGTRVLQVVVNEQYLTPIQMNNMQKIVETANKMGIEVEAIILK
nr:hypothetical protein [Fusobacterium necrophorum]